MCFTFYYFFDRPTTTKEGKTYTMREAMLIIILQEYLLSTDVSTVLKS